MAGANNGFGDLRKMTKKKLNIGLVGAIELSSREGAPGARAYDGFVDCFKKGLLIRVTGDVIALSPPLIVDKEQIDTIVSIIGDAIKRAA